MRFKGRYNGRLDAKGRMSMPAPLREQLAELGVEILAATCTDRCLELVPKELWDRLVEKVDALPALREDVELFDLFYVSSAVDVAIDSHGRILIPQTLREEVGLEREIVVVGKKDKIQVYSQRAWEEVSELARRRFADIRNQLSPELK